MFWQITYIVMQIGRSEDVFSSRCLPGSILYEVCKGMVFYSNKEIPADNSPLLFLFDKEVVERPVKTIIGESSVSRFSELHQRRVRKNRI